MPTKTRYILKLRDGTMHTGKIAVAIVCKSINKLALTAIFPPHWADMPTSAKLRFLAANMTKGTTLTIYREPRYCRKNKSLYLRAVRRRAAGEDAFGAEPLRWEDELPPQVPLPQAEVAAGRIPVARPRPRPYRIANLEENQ